MIKSVCVALVFVFLFLTIASAFWFEKTPEEASEYIYNIDVGTIRLAFIRYEVYVRMSVNNITSTIEDTKRFLAELGDDAYDVLLGSLEETDFSALIDIYEGDVSSENIVTVFREFFLFVLRFGRNFLGALGSFVKLNVLLVKLLWYGAETILTGVVGIFDVLFTFIALFKGAEGTTSPSLPDVPTIPVEPM